MKANWLLFIILMLWGVTEVTAQTTGPQNVPPAGSSLIFNPFQTTGTDAGTDGTDREYNFSYVKSFPLERFSWSSPDSMGRMFFPTSNLTTDYYQLYGKIFGTPGFRSPFIPSGFDDTSYLTSDEQGLKVLGNANTFTFNTTANGDTFAFLPQSAAYSQPKLLLPYGLKFGDRLPTQTVTQQFFGGRIRGNRIDTFMVVRSVITTIQADGQGRLSTPSNYYPSVLRVRADVTQVDSVFLNNGFFIEKYEISRFTPTHFSWYVPNKPAPVVTMVYDGATPVYGNYLTDTFTVTANFGELRRDVAENVGVIQVPIILTQPANDTISLVLNSYYPAPKATPGVDFVEIRNEVVTFLPGETSKMVEVAVLEDSVIEEDEYFALGIDEITPNAKIGTVDRFLVKILDDDVPVIRFMLTDTTVREDSALVYIPLTIDHPLTDSVEVYFKVLERTARADSDYVKVDYKVTLLPDKKVFYFPVEILNDSLNEVTESFALSISRVSKNVRIGISDTVRINILDDDFRPNVRFFTESITTSEATNEPANVFSVPIRISFPIYEPVTIRVRTSDGSASGDVNDNYPGKGDYVNVDTEVTAAPQDTVVYVQVPINNDEEVEGDEDFNLFIEAISENAQRALENQVIRVIIKDNDPFVSAGRPLVSEKIRLYPNPTSGSITLSLPENVRPQNLTLVNSLGQAADISYEIRDGKVTSDVSHVAAGVYMLRLTTDNGPVTQRLIIQK